jgi:hypothetical protein
LSEDAEDGGFDGVGGNGSEEVEDSEGIEDEAAAGMPFGRVEAWRQVRVVVLLGEGPERSGCREEDFAGGPP